MLALCGGGVPLFCALRGQIPTERGNKVKCEFCSNDAPALMTLRVYTRRGIKVCDECYRTIDSHRHKPYSKVMDRLALVEAGYHVNRKLATLARTGW